MCYLRGEEKLKLIKKCLSYNAQYAPCIYRVLPT